MMYIGNNFMVQIKTANKSLWHNEYFVDEKSARKHANEQWAAGAQVVSLWQKTRNGYRLVKEVKRSENEAKAMSKVFMGKLQQEAENYLSTILN